MHFRKCDRKFLKVIFWERQTILYSPVIIAHMSLQPRSNCNIISGCTTLLSNKQHFEKFVHKGLSLAIYLKPCGIWKKNIDFLSMYRIVCLSQNITVKCILGGSGHHLCDPGWQRGFQIVVHWKFAPPSKSARLNFAPPSKSMLSNLNPLLDIMVANVGIHFKSFLRALHPKCMHSNFAYPLKVLALKF